ncbi:MAG: site-specific integrase [Cytophagaceae bacterium]|nr:site-specific integrase [Cytophagaceae bacterium]
MRKSVKLIFFPKNQKKNKDGRVPIYLKISFSYHLPVEISTGVYTQFGQWDPKYKRIPGEGESIENLNDQLVLIRQKVKKIISDHWNHGMITPQEIKALYCCESEMAIITLVDLYRKYINELKPKINTSMAPSTEATYETHLQKLITFLEHIKRPNILPMNFTPQLGLELKQFFINKPGRKVSPESATITLKFINRVFNFGVSLQIIPYNPIQSLDLKIKVRHDRTSLDINELKLMEDYMPDKDSKQKTKTLFLFSCYTGLSYIDTQVFCKENHIVNIDGKLCIRLLRFKNRFRKDHPDTFVPLSDKAIKLLEENNYTLPQLPKSSYDYNIKKIGEELGITKKLSSHKARKTFGNILINEAGVPLEIVSLQLVY